MKLKPRVMDCGLWSQGSFGLYNINPENGVRIGHVIRVWAVQDKEGKMYRFITRKEAREKAYELMNQ